MISGSRHGDDAGPRAPYVQASVRLLPGLAAGASALALAGNVTRITHALAWRPDLVSPMVIADTVATAGGPHNTVFGTYAPYTTIWFDVATRRLPFHRMIWELGPVVLALVGVGLLVWVSWRLAGRWAALVTLAIGLAWSVPVTETLAAQANHGVAYFVVCVLAAFLAMVALRPPGRGPLVALTAVVGVLAGVNVASDPLLLLVGIAPMVGAPVLVAIRRWSPETRRVLVVAVAGAAVALIVGMGTARAMRADGYRALGVSAGSPVALASVSDAQANAGRLGRNLLRIWSADVVAGDRAPVKLARWALAGPVLAVVALPLVLLFLVLGRPLDSAPQASAEALWMVFWGLVVGVLLVGSVFGQVAVENASRSIIYLTPIVLAGAATLPVVAARSQVAMAGVAVGVGVLCLLSTIDLLAPVPMPAYTVDLPGVIAALQRRGLHRGYAAYGSASALTYKSRGALAVRPVFPCVAASGAPTVCRFFSNRVESWYVPEPAGRTFVVSDAIHIPVLRIPTPPPPALGPPTETITVGTQTIFVYPYDVATRFGPPF